MYTIYHIPGVKVGCTSRNPEVRVMEQGYGKYEVLEKLSSLEEASIRERYWQEKLGYRKDVDSYTTVRVKAKKSQTFESRRKTSEGTKKVILQLDKDGNFIAEWPSLKFVKAAFGQSVGDCLRGRLKTSQGFIWKYK